MSLPHGFKRVMLHLARTREHPDGSARHGYDLLVPLDADGRIDADAWRRHRDACRARRFWPGEPDRIGRIVHRAGGAGGHTWLIDYDETREDDDESAFRLGDHALAPGEYVSIRDDEGAMHTFRVVSVAEAG